MPFPFSCPHCHHTSPVPDQLLGSTAKCPNCGAVVKIVVQSVQVARPFVPAPVEHLPAAVAIEDDFRMPPAPARSTSGGGAFLALAFIALLLLLGCGGGGFVVFWFWIRPAAIANVEPTNSSPTTKKEAEDSKPAPSKSPSEATAKKVHRDLLKSTVWLVSADDRHMPLATATFIDRDERLLVTNYRVVRKSERVIAFTAMFENDEPVTKVSPYLDSIKSKGIPGRMVASDESRDLALIKLEEWPAEAQIAPLASDSAELKQSVYTIGAAEQMLDFGESEDALWRFRATTVKRVGERSHKYADGANVTVRTLDFPLPNAPNDYGGPVVDVSGRLLGVTCDFKQQKQEIVCAIDVREVRSVVEAHFKKIGKRWTGGGPAIPDSPPSIDENEQLPSYWIDMLREGEEAKTNRARKKLIEMGRAAMLDLRKAMREPNPKLRQLVISILGALGEVAVAAVDDLIKALGDADDLVRTEAARSLGKIGKKAHAALPRLIVATTDSHKSVQNAARESLRQIGPPIGADITGLAPLWKEREAKNRFGYATVLRELKPDVEVLSTVFPPLLRDSDLNVRVLAANVVGGLGPSVHARAFIPLLTAIDDPSAELRTAALAALAKVGPALPAERSALENGLRSQYAECRLFCVEQLGQLRDEAKSSIPDIARLLTDLDRFVRAAAAKALGRIGKPAVLVLDDLLSARQDRDANVRHAAIEALAQLGREKGVVQALFRALEDDDRIVREAAMKALRSFRPPLTLDEQVHLKVALKSKLVEGRRLAAGEFARMGREAASALPEMLDAMRDPDAEVRRHVFAFLTVQEKAATVAVPLLLDSLARIAESNAKNEGEIELYRQVVTTLEKMGELKSAMPMLTKALKTKNPALRKEVVQTLALVGDEARKVHKELCALIDDPQVGALVAETLVKLRGDEIVRTLCDIVDEGPSMPARIAAARTLGRIGPDAKDAYQSLYKASTRYRGKELGETARESLKLTQRK